MGIRIKRLMGGVQSLHRLPLKATITRLVNVMSIAIILSFVNFRVLAAENLLQSDFPFQGACVGANFPSNNVALKGLAIRLPNNAAMLFDTDLCRMAAGWVGGYITTHGVVFDGAHGNHPQMVGDQKFGTANLPGIAGSDGHFSDSRPEPFGPIDASIVRWDGLLVSGMDVLLRYTVGGNLRVSEQPGSVALGDQVGFVRTFRIESEGNKVKDTFSILIADIDGATVTEWGNQAVLEDGDLTTRIATVGSPIGAGLKVEKGRVRLEIPSGALTGTFKVIIWKGPTSQKDVFSQMAVGVPTQTDFAQGGRNRWSEAVVVSGRLATSATPDGAYVTDTITTPEKNPWHRRVRFGGFDFFADGRRAAFCTHDGTFGLSPASTTRWNIWNGVVLLRASTNPLVWW